MTKGVWGSSNRSNRRGKKLVSKTLGELQKSSRECSLEATGASSSASSIKSEEEQAVTFSWSTRLGLSNRRYYVGSLVRKPLFRGWLHLIMLCLSPAWTWYFWQLASVKSLVPRLNVTETFQHTWPFLGWHIDVNALWCVDLASIIALLATSCYYHLPCHASSRACDRARKLDMFVMSVAIYLNLLPQLLYCQLQFEALVYALILLYQYDWYFFFQPPCHHDHHFNLYLDVQLCSTRPRTLSMFRRQNDTSRGTALQHP